MCGKNFSKRAKFSDAAFQFATFDTYEVYNSNSFRLILTGIEGFINDFLPVFLF